MSIPRTIRRPEYTGENRCWACTAVNSAIAVLVAVLVGAVVGRYGSTPSAVGAGGLFLAVAATAIWLRGYLVPRTPALTKRYVPDWLLRRFGKRDGRGGAPDWQRLDLEAVLTRAGVVEPCEGIEDLCLADRFDVAWRAERDDLPAAVAHADAIHALGFDPDAVRVEEHDDGAVLVHDSWAVLQWPSPTALRLDVAAARALADEWIRWGEYAPPDRSRVVEGMRTFVEECPDGSPVELAETEVESCCSTRRVVTLSCAGSGEPILEQPVG